MASGKSLELAAIPRRTPQWVHKHTVADLPGSTVTEPLPGPANRRERRAMRGLGWFMKPVTTPYVKPVPTED